MGRFRLGDYEKRLLLRLVAFLAVLATVLGAGVWLATSDPHGFEGAPAIAKGDVGRLEPLYGTMNTPWWSLDWSPDGRWIAVGGGDSLYDALILDARTGAVAHVLTPSLFQPAGSGLLPRTSVHAVRWSPSGSQLAILAESGFGGGAWVHIYSWQGEHEAAWPTEQRYVLGLAWAPDGTRLLTAGGGDFAIWDSGSYARLVHAMNVSSGNFVDWSPDGALFAVGIYNGIYVYDATTATLVLRIPSSSGGVAWSHAGDRIVSAADDGCATMHRRDGSLLWRSAAGWCREPMYGVLSPAWDPSDTMVAIPSFQGTAVFDASTGNLLRILEFPVHRYGPSYSEPRQGDIGVVWSPTGEAIASVGRSNAPSLRMWGVRHSAMAGLSAAFQGVVIIGLPLVLYPGLRFWFPPLERRRWEFPSTAAGCSLLLGALILSILQSVHLELVHRTYNAIAMPSVRWLLATAILSVGIGAIAAVAMVVAFRGTMRAGLSTTEPSPRDEEIARKVNLVGLLIIGVIVLLSVSSLAGSAQFRADTRVLVAVIVLASLIYIAAKGARSASSLLRTGGTLGIVLLPIIWTTSVGLLVESLLLALGVRVELGLLGAILGISCGVGLVVSSVAYAPLLGVTVRKFAGALVWASVISFLTALFCTVLLALGAGPLTVALYGPEIAAMGASILFGFGLAPFIFGLIAIGIALATTTLGLALPKAAAALYSRLTPEQVVDQEARRQILGYLKAHPGVHFRELLRALEMGSGALHYHLRVLERAGMIVPERAGMYLRYFAARGAF